MDKAKAAVSDFLHKSGKHDTSVEEVVAPAVTNENISRTRHEEATTAIDREIHKDHHHTSVLPITDKEVRPEQHHHRMAGVETRQHREGNDRDILAGVEAERAQFKGTRTEAPIRETSSTGGVVAGEHVHHHVHETIQPVVQKEIVEPSVVHTTVPVHEVVHKGATHHSSSTLPSMTMNEFTTQGGSLTGREARHDGFEGEPKGLGAAAAAAVNGNHHHHNGATGTTGVNRGTDDYEGTASAGQRDGRTGYDNTRTGTGATGYDSSNVGGKTAATGPHKSNLMNKLDPRVDSDRDGKVGAMD